MFKAAATNHHNLVQGLSISEFKQISKIIVQLKVWEKVPNLFENDLSSVD